MAALPLLGCSDDGAGGTGASGTDTNVTAGTSASSMTSSADGTESDTQMTASGESGSNSNSDSTPNGDCGNGAMDPGEECDNGEMNSDETPDACRTNCVLPYCYDGVTDPSANEECDDGDLNGPDPDSCRADCLLPRCGDGIQDLGEACDDGNEEWGDTCFACDNRYYFILNSPDLAGGGNASIIRALRDGDFVELVGGDAANNGMLKVALSADLLTLFALQGGAPSNVLSFDPVDGAAQPAIALDTAALGFDADGRAMAVGSDGMLYVAAVGGGTNHMIQMDPEGGAVTDFLDMGAGFEMLDMIGSDEGGLYVTTGAGNSIMRVDLAAPAITTLTSGLDNPLGISWDPNNQWLWTVNNPAGTPAQSISVDLAGTLMPDAFAATLVAPMTTGVVFDIGDVLLVTVPAENRIIAIQTFDVIGDVFTDGIDAPSHIAAVSL